MPAVSGDSAEPATSGGVTPPNADTAYFQQIAMSPGTDIETGEWGYGYSPDNGLHFYVTDTTFGRKYRQEDADRLWKYLEPMISDLIDKKLNNGGESSGSKES